MKMSAPSVEVVFPATLPKVVSHIFGPLQMISLKQIPKQIVAGVSEVFEVLEGATWVVTDQRVNIEAQKKLDSTLYVQLRHVMARLGLLLLAQYKDYLVILGIYS